MEKSRLCYISRNYYDKTSAGNKAKTDYEDILSDMGAVSIGLPRRISGHKAVAFVYNLLGVLLAGLRMRRGDVIVLQYPVKKYFTLICRMARLRGARTMSLIHDLGSFRRRKLTVREELRRLSHTDYVIATNAVMASWLKEQGLRVPTGALGFHDYLSGVRRQDVPRERVSGTRDIVYAGSLNLRKNAFILHLKEMDRTFRLHLYGEMTDYQAIADDSMIVWHGFVRADDFIGHVQGDFGLVWDGDSPDECRGDFGGYLRYNTPHKASFYLRAGLPLIVWEQSAIAPLVRQYGVGITVASLGDLNQWLLSLSDEEYRSMKDRVWQLSDRIASGAFLREAVGRGLECLSREQADALRQ